MPLVEIAFRKLLNLKPFLTWRRVFIVYVICSNWALVNAVTTALEENSSFYTLALKLSAPGNLVHLAITNSLLSTAFLVRTFPFLGFVSASELESLCTDSDVWLYVMDVSLALAATKQNLVLDLPLSIMLGFLLLAKCSHKLLAGRIDLMVQEQHLSPGSPLLRHIRALGLVSLLALEDLGLLLFVAARWRWDRTRSPQQLQGLNVSVLLANEYAIMLGSLFNTTARYTLGVLEQRRASNGSTVEDTMRAYVDLLTETYNLFTNLLFFVIITKSSEVFPIHSIRRVGWAGSSVWTKFTSIRQVKFPQKTSVQHDRFAVVDAREKGVSANVS